MNQNNNNVKGQQQQPNGNTPKAVITEPAPLVQQAAQQNFFANGNRAVGRYENPNVVKPPLENAGEVMPPQQGNVAVETAAHNGEGVNPGPVTETPVERETPSWNNMPQQPTGWNPDGSAQYGSLSDALNSNSNNGNVKPQAEFKADPEKKDGGFFNWIKGLIPKKRAGMRPGETEDEYDRRRTRNMQMVATLADAIRHMGNIINTSKGAPVQQFNDMNTMLEQGYQTRKAQRQKQAALDADAAYKQANLSLKERAAEADKAYKEYLKQMNVAKFGYQQAKDAAAMKRQAEQDEQKQKNWEKAYEFRKNQAAISNSLRQQSINKRGSGGSGGKGGSSGGYSIYNPNTGKYEYFKNEKSWISRAAELGYDTGKGDSSSTVTDTGLTKKTVNKSGTSVATKIGQQTRQKKAENAAKAQQKRQTVSQKPKASQGGGKKTGGKSKNGYKNTKALGL